ncbi:ATPase [Enterobacter hormaechei]|uniref:ATPase n=1 Tax=Enterobacter hormaechei TaxID=158836 RepID=UPI003B8410F1
MNLNAALSTDLLKEGRNKEQFVGRPFYLSYDIARLLVCDAWKAQVKGIPAGCFLLAFYDGEDGVEEAVLLRALSQTKLPTDNDVISSMIEYYKDNLDISGRAGSLKGGKLDEFTRYEFSFSGLECRVLGVFYRTQKGNIEFGADLENFYAANNYTVYKANGDVLEFIVNQRDDGGLVGQDSEFKIGSVRYSSSRRHQSQEENVNVWVNPKDFLGKRSAMFGMTRTGKSNTVKKVIEATEEISRKALILLDSASPETSEFTSSGSPTFPVGQIIFDVNGEYANANRQDSGTAIYDLYKEKVYRYSVLEKNDFKVMKVNFFKDIESGFSLISSYFQEQSLGGDYVNNFIAVSFEKPESTNLNGPEWTRYNRLVAAYKCCLYRAGFKAPNGEKIKFTGAAEINSEILEDRVLDPKLGLTLEEACTWFERVWEQYDDLKFFKDYINKKGYEWANDDLKSMMVFLTTYKLPGKKIK